MSDYLNTENLFRITTESGDYIILDPAGTAQTIGGHYVDKYKKQLRAQQVALEAREQEKLSQAKDLRRQIEEARNPPVVELEPKVEEKQVLQPKIQAKVPDLRNDLKRIETELALLAKEILLANYEMKQQQDEEDIETILQLLH